MGELNYTQEEIQSFFDSQEFIDLTCAQIKKDLIGLYEGDFEPDLEATSSVLDLLITQISDVLDSLAHNSNQNLMQFLYKVDLPESIALNSLLIGNNFDKLAFEIIRREAQKVYFRKKFG